MPYLLQYGITPDVLYLPISQGETVGYVSGTQHPRCCFFVIASSVFRGKYFSVGELLVTATRDIAVLPFLLLTK